MYRKVCVGCTILMRQKDRTHLTLKVRVVSVADVINQTLAVVGRPSLVRRAAPLRKDAAGAVAPLPTAHIVFLNHGSAIEGLPKLSARVRAGVEREGADGEERREGCGDSKKEDKLANDVGQHD